MIYQRKALLLLTSALVMAQTGFSSTATWNLNDVTFSDAATASGSFDWNADSQTLSNWDISVTSGALSAFTYTPADSTAGSYFQETGYENELMFMADGSTRQLRLTPLTALTDAGGTVDINLNTFGGGSGSVECFNCSPYRPVVSGSFSAQVANTPEPGSMGLLGFGLVGAGIFARKLRTRFTRKIQNVI